MEEKCVQDCNSKFNRLASIVSCGGVVSDASVVLYDSPYDCCAEKLTWLSTDDCFKRSIKVSTGWLNDTILDLPSDQLEGGGYLGISRILLFGKALYFPRLHVANKSR